MGAEQRQTETDHELRRDADGDIEHGDAEGAELAPGPEGPGEEQEDGQQQGRADEAAEDSRRGDPPALQIGHQAPQQKPGARRQQQPAVPGHGCEDAEEMKLLAAEEEFLEIEPADKAEPIAAGHELEARESQIGGDQQGEDGEGEDHHHRRQDEQPVGTPVEPGRKAAGRESPLLAKVSLARGRLHHLFVALP